MLPSGAVIVKSPLLTKKSSTSLILWPSIRAYIPCILSSSFASSLAIQSGGSAGKAMFSVLRSGKNKGASAGTSKWRTTSPLPAPVPATKNTGPSLL